MYDTTSSNASNISQENKNNLDKNTTTEDNREISETVEDHRHHDFTIIDNKFIRAGFDSDTVYTYLMIVNRAANNEKGFFESVETTSNKSGISKRQLKYCRKLLEYCNIIQITKRYDSANNNRQTSSLITLIEKKYWNLNHEWRNAFDFGTKDYKEKENPGVQQLHPPRAVTAPPPVQQLHTYQDPDQNKITDKQDPPKGGGGEKTTTTNLKHGYATTLLADMLALVFCKGRKYKMFSNEEADQIMSKIMTRTNINKKEAIEILEEIILRQIPYSVISPSGDRDNKVIEDDFIIFINNFKKDK